MKIFRFPLERVLHWRTTQLELERAAMQRLVQRKLELEHAFQAIASNRNAEEFAIAHASSIDSRELQTLSAYQSRTVREKTNLLNLGAQLERETAAQLGKITEAQRRVKLLERLREQRLQEWTGELAKEQEQFAAEAWLGQWPMLKAGDAECNRNMATGARMDTTLPQS